MKTRITADKLLALNQSTADMGDYAFWHYTKLESVCKIIENQYFLLGNLTCMNDILECEEHKDCANQIYVLSFCNSNTEKIPMWYLYSGIDGKGCSIGITAKGMSYFIDSIKTVKTYNSEKVLTIGKDFDLESGWVYYINKKEPNQVFYRNKWYDLTTMDDDLIKKSLFIKSYPWEYEREFRIIIKLKKDIPNEKIRIDIPEKLKSKIRLKTAPEIENESLNELQKIINYKSIKTEIKASELSIHMNLFNRNLNHIKELVKKHIDKWN